MEAIKCPNCGSEKCQEVTKEKWICLACDNVFLIHNLSKEFKKTDKHLTEVHQDLSRKLDEISNVSKTETNKCLYEAEEMLKKGDCIGAYSQFKEYAAMLPDSYVGYEGMYRALVNDYQDALGDIWALDDRAKLDNFAAPMYMGFDVLKKALECPDVDKQMLLSKVSKYYKSNTKKLLFRYLFEKPEVETEQKNVSVKNSLNQLKEEAIFRYELSPLSFTKWHTPLLKISNLFLSGCSYHFLCPPNQIYLSAL